MRPLAGTGNRSSAKGLDFPGIMASIPERNRATVTVRSLYGWRWP
jgi:hypothetical protein